MPLNAVLDALLVGLKWSSAVAVGLFTIWLFQKRSAIQEMDAAIDNVRALFTFLETRGFRWIAQHRGDSFDFVWVEYRRDSILARVGREKTYWALSLRRTDQPQVSFDAIEAFPLIGLGKDPSLPYGPQSAEVLASTIAPVIEPLLELVSEAGMSRIAVLRDERSRQAGKGQS